MQQCETPDQAAAYWKAHIATHPYFNSECECLVVFILKPAPLLTPTRLLALLDKAKAFPLLKKQPPELLAGAEARTFGDKTQVTDFNDYEIRIEEVFRFNPEDTLVFHVTLRNKSDKEIYYLPESFCVRGRQPALLSVHQ